MPPVFLALAAAAGFFAAARVIATLIAGADQEKPPHGPETATHAGETARDLGRLEWDNAAGVYRPRPPSSSS